MPSERVSEERLERLRKYWSRPGGQDHASMQNRVDHLALIDEIRELRRENERLKLELRDALKDTSSYAQQLGGKHD